MLKKALPVSLLLALTFAGCSDNTNPVQTPRPYTIPAELVLDAHASRIADGRIVISGTTNLPDGLKMWIEIEQGRSSRGASNVIATDDSVIVKDGKFSSASLWSHVPNTRFAKSGWPDTVSVDTRDVPFPQRTFTVHFTSYFNSAWQTPEVLSSLGGEDGKKLKGEILAKTDPDVIDSPKIVDYRLALPSH